jgi:hypothetical protein
MGGVSATSSSLISRRTWLRGPVADAVAIAALAFVLRFGIVLFSNGGPGGMYGYDAGVYYSAADALTFGRVPYRDFVFLHPPGLMLLLTPFAALGRLTTDHAGYVVANLFFDVLAAINAVLVWTIARRWGLSRRAASAWNRWGRSCSCPATCCSPGGTTRAAPARPWPERCSRWPAA